MTVLGPIAATTPAPPTLCATPTTCANCKRSSSKTPRASRPGRGRWTGCCATSSYTVEIATQHGHDELDVLQLASYRAAYQQIIATGYLQNPLNTTRTGQRGFIAQTPARNLLGRLDAHREDVLRFAHDTRISFDNNLVERDIRMVKLQQKISGCWRTTTGADHFLALRAYLSTTRKQGRHLLDALTQLAAHNPWLPQATSP